MLPLPVNVTVPESPPVGRQNGKEGQKRKVRRNCKLNYQKLRIDRLVAGKHAQQSNERPGQSSCCREKNSFERSQAKTTLLEPLSRKRADTPQVIIPRPSELMTRMIKLGNWMLLSAR
jgi:hypothetical protein